MMQRTNNTESVTVAHRKLGASTTLNRKYVKKPMKSNDITVPIKRSPKIERFSSSLVDKSRQQQLGVKESSIEAARIHPMQAAANIEMNRRKTENVQQARQLTAKEIKDQAIRKALIAASKSTESENRAQQEAISEDKISTKMHFGFPRVLLALSCAAAVVLAIAYFVNLNMPDISMRVAAMQTGFNASYPGHIPRGYKLTGITSEENKMTLNFVNSSTDEEFTLIEETSSWDSNALLNSYFKPTYGEGYTTVKEQGLTIYIDGSDAAWVNGGIFYKLKTTKGSLTKKQICSIAVSL